MQERINKKKKEEARSHSGSGSRGPGSVRAEKSEADPYSGYLLLGPSTAFKPPTSDSAESYLWAVRQILETSSCTFAYPRNYVLNNR